MPRRRVSRPAAALACGAVGWAAMTLAFATTVVPAATGCTTRTCDSSSGTWKTGDWIDENTWETSNVNGAWMPYRGNETITIFVNGPDGRDAGSGPPPYSVESYIGFVEDGGDHPNSDDTDAGNNFTPGAGAEVEYLDWSHDRVVVLNNTCATYVARFVIHFPPSEADASSNAD